MLEGPHHRLDIRVWHCLEDFICKLEFGSDVDVGTLIFSRIAVLRSGKDGDATTIVFNLVTAHPHLVGANDSLQAVVFAEALGHIRAKLETDTTLAGAATNLGLRVCPEHLHHQAGLAGLPLVVAVELADIIQLDLVIGEETTVQDKVLVANQGGQWQSRERLGEHLEDPLVIFSLALAFEAVYLIHIVRLVVSTVKEKTVRTQPLVCV